MYHSKAFGGLVVGVPTGPVDRPGMSVRERILARIDAEPDGVPLTKLLYGLPIPSGEGRHEELRAMLIEKVIVGEMRRHSGPGRPRIYFRRATAARADS